MCVCEGCVCVWVSACIFILVSFLDRPSHSQAGRQALTFTTLFPLPSRTTTHPLPTCLRFACNALPPHKQVAPDNQMCTSTNPTFLDGVRESGQWCSRSSYQHRHTHTDTHTQTHTYRHTHRHTQTHTHTWTHTDTHARARISHCLIAAPLFFQTRPPPSSVAVETLHRFASTPPRDRRFRQFSETFHSDRHGVLCVEFTGQSADKLRRAFAFPQHNNNNSSSSSSSSGASTRNNLIFPLRTAPTFEFLRKHADLLGSTVSVRTLGGVGNKHMLAARCSCPNLPQDLATATEGHVIMGTSPTVRPGYPVHFLRKKPPVQRKRVDVQGRIVYKCDKCVSSFEAGGRKRKRERKGEREGERDVMTRGREARTCISGFHSLCLSFVP